MKTYLEIAIIGLVLALSGILAFFWAPRLLAPATEQNSSNKVCFGQKCAYVRLAATRAEREVGLMSVAHLDADKGMLFIFDREGVYPFWMKKTLIPLDMIWLDSNYNVVFIKRNAMPCGLFLCPSINPGVKAKYVLELNGGISDQWGIKAGDVAVLNIR